MQFVKKGSRRGRESVFLNIVLLILSLSCIVPLWLVVSISLSNEHDIMNFGYMFIPKAIDFSAYNFILQNPEQLIDSYVVTIFVSVAGMILGVALMVLVAYALSRPTFVARKQITFYLFFTMLFSGGLVPAYILTTQYLHLSNSIWVYILPHLINPWHIVLLRTFFQKQPSALFEAAKIDGAGEFHILAKIAVPMAKPVIATVSLFTLLLRWNDWMTSLLYITEDNLISLQYLLQKMMRDIQLITQNMDHLPPGMSFADLPSESARMAMAVLAAGPMLCVFPFFQKYFAKGLTVGGVKG